MRVFLCAAVGYVGEMPLITGKSARGRYVSNVNAKAGSNIVRYYPHSLLSDFNAAILAELGEKPARR